MQAENKMVILGEMRELGKDSTTEPWTRHRRVYSQRLRTRFREDEKGQRGQNGKVLSKSKIIEKRHAFLRAFFIFSKTYKG